MYLDLAARAAQVDAIWSEGLQGMTQTDTITEILRQLASANDRVAAARQIVLEHGGQWADDPPPSGIFEIQLLGLVGIGSGAATAIEDWMAQAEAMLARPLARSA